MIKAENLGRGGCVLKTTSALPRAFHCWGCDYVPVHKKHLLKALKVVGFVPVVRGPSFLTWCKVCGDTASPKHFVKQTGDHQEGIGMGQHFVPCVCGVVITVVFLPVTRSDTSNFSTGIIWKKYRHKKQGQKDY